MRISTQDDGASPHFSIQRGDGGVTLDLAYKPGGSGTGGIESTLGDGHGAASGTNDAPIELSYFAKLEDGVTTEGQYVITGEGDEDEVTFDFTVTSYASAAVFAGTDVADYVFGSELDDSIAGGAGDDVLYGYGGADSIAGGDGDDRVRAGDGDDVVNGDDGDDFLAGNLGDDQLFGGAGDDTLSGRLGSDTLTGGEGADVFLFATPLGPDDVDTITDFASGEDSISLSDDVFAAFMGLETLEKGQFAVTTDGLATDAAQRIVYNSETGELFYDADGSGAAAAILFAKLAPETEIGKGDFLIV